MRLHRVRVWIPLSGSSKSTLFRHGLSLRTRDPLDTGGRLRDQHKHTSDLVVPVRNRSVRLRCMGIFGADPNRRWQERRLDVRDDEEFYSIWLPEVLCGVPSRPLLPMRVRSSLPLFPALIAEWGVEDLLMRYLFFVLDRAISEADVKAARCLRIRT